MLSLREIKRQLDINETLIREYASTGDLEGLVRMINQRDHLKNCLIDKLEGNYKSRNPWGKVIVKKGA